mgnify:FL=1
MAKSLILDKIKVGDTTIYLREREGKFWINTRYSQPYQSVEGQDFVLDVWKELLHYGEIEKRVAEPRFRMLAPVTELTKIKVFGVTLILRSGYAHYKIQSYPTKDREAVLKVWQIIKGEY